MPAEDAEKDAEGGGVTVEEAVAVDALGVRLWGSEEEEREEKEEEGDGFTALLPLPVVLLLLNEVLLLALVLGPAVPVSVRMCRSPSCV